MAIILSRQFDYMKAEILLFKAIKIFETKSKEQQLYYCYNLLGVIYLELEEFQKSLNYHKKAQKYIDNKFNNSKLKIYNYNNIGLLYQKLGDHENALTYFNHALNVDNQQRADSALYARLLDNRAYSRMHISNSGLYHEDQLKALEIRKRIANLPGIIMSQLHLAEHYLKCKDTGTAVQYARKSYALANSISLNREILDAAAFLAKHDSRNRQQYLERFISLTTELKAQERNTRNKFTRIRFETDRYIEENRMLSYGMFGTVASSAIILIVLGLLYLLFRQRSRNRVLALESDRQQANEQIYRMTTELQERLQQGRNQERKRISEVMHDSILGDLFALRLHWGFLNFTGSEEDASTHNLYLIELQRIENDIRELSHDLEHLQTEYPLEFEHIVERLIKKRSAVGLFNYILEIDERIDWNLPDNLIKLNLYRILGEALQNVIKHADAANVEVHFKMMNKMLEMKISDNGKGMSMKSEKGIGLKNIRNRVRRLKGNLQLKSKENFGTTLIITIPLKNYQYEKVPFQNIVDR
ncbi:tetratricopeptide repeat-containing sensor histidine kinase [Robertkochia solimangrovi]|uniref:tetratricopeptide repeat-containing sensor histidine kinase n=1 Tax=Robertkochia solimangrovi TaxID=2213046 RepID=UPI0013A535EB|nr:tetratricopeptide repeat-containing sensor histidine kinase [Robertkochia solimangrovi]